MRKIIAVLFLGLVFGVFSSELFAEDMHHEEKEGVKHNELTTRSPYKDEIGKEAICPVMVSKHKVKAKTEVIDYKGESYYFCCSGCPDQFKKDPDRYAKKPSEMSQVFIRKARKEEIGKEFVCPVMGGDNKVKPETVAAEYQGEIFYFCCLGCIDKFTENPKKYIKDMHEHMRDGEHGMMKKKSGMLSGKIVDRVREINIKAFQFGFEPDTIIVKKGEKIRLKAISTDVTHGIGIKKYKFKKKLPVNKEQIIEFTADNAGNFHFYCTVYCGAGHGKMHGTLIVKE